MAKITRYTGNVKAFGANATGTDRTVFGDITQSDLLNDNLNASFLTGWGILAAGAKPPKEYFNGALFTATQLVSYLFQQGIPEWDSLQEFNIGSISVAASGAIMRSKTNLNIGNNPDTDSVNWEYAVSTGTKNLLINGHKLIQQRGLTGGTKQVVLNTRNIGGAHTISFTGTATVTIKEATTLAASDALTTWDAALVTGATSGTTVTLTAGKYVHVEFSTTDFDYALLEPGSVPTNYPILEDTLEPCLPYYQQINIPLDYTICLVVIRSNLGYNDIKFETTMRSTPIVSFTGTTNTDYPATGIDPNNIAISSLISRHGFNIRVGGTVSNGIVGRVFASSPFSFKANSEIFNADDGVGINYKEDRWYL